MTTSTLSKTEQRWVALALTFPCLADAKSDWLKGSKRGPVAELAHWRGRDPGVTGGGDHAAKFMLGVWNSQSLTDRFDFHHACNVWDCVHMRAFLAWAQAPWYA